MVISRVPNRYIKRGDLVALLNRLFSEPYQIKVSRPLRLATRLIQIRSIMTPG